MVAFTGTSGNDSIVGSTAADTIDGAAGNDTLAGGVGADSIQGGLGDDLITWRGDLFNNDGADTIDGGAGADTLAYTANFGGIDSAPSKITALSNGHVSLSGFNLATVNAVGVETLSIRAPLGAVNQVGDLSATDVRHLIFDFRTTSGLADSSADKVSLTATANADNVVAVFSPDGANLSANLGLVSADFLGVDSRDLTTFNLGAGDDVFSVSGLGSARLAINGGAGDDRLSGGAESDSFAWATGGGSDTVDGGAGVDSQSISLTAAASVGLAANAGHVLATLVGAQILDLVNVETIAVTGSSGNDAVLVGGSLGGVGLSLSGGSGDDILQGSDGADTLTGGSGNDVLSGGDGADVINAQGGDVVDGGAGFDVANVSPIFGNSTLQVVSSASHIVVTSSGAPQLDLVRVEAINFVGNSSNDVISAQDLTTSAQLSFSGADGNDSIVGSLGADSIDGGLADDVLQGGGGADTIEGGGGADTGLFNFNVSVVSTIAASSDHVLVTSNGVTSDLHGVETLFLKSLDGGDVINLGDLTGTGVRTINVDLSNASGLIGTVVNLADAPAGGVVTVTPGNGTEQVVYTVNGTVVETVNVTNIGALDRVNLPGTFALGTAGADSIHLFPDPSGVASVTENGGAPTAIPAGVATFTIQPGQGADTVTVDDVSATSLKTLNVDLGRDGAGDTVVLNYLTGNHDLQLSPTTAGLQVVSQTLAETILGTTNVQGLEAGDTVQINLGDGDDLVGATGVPSVGPLVVNGGGGKDILQGGPGETMNGGVGDDFVTSIGGVANGDEGADTVEGGFQAETLSGGAGADSVAGFDGNDLILWNAGDGSDSIDGGAGTDTVTLTATAGADAVVLSASATHETATVNGAAAIDAIGVETVNVRAGAGADAIEVDFLAGSSVRVVNVDLSGATAGATDGEADLVRVVGSAASDTIATVGLAGGGYRIVEPNVTNSAVVITSLDAGDGVMLDAGAGEDKVNVDLSAPVSLTVDGNAGFDTVSGFIENTADTIVFSNGTHVTHGAAAIDLVNVEAFNATIVGSEGQTNTFVVNGSDNADAYRVSAANGVASVVQSPGAPTINIANFAGNDVLAIHAGGGDDHLDWDGVTSSFDGGGGFDSVSAFVHGSGEIVLGPSAQVIGGGSSLFLSNVENVELSGNFFGADFQIVAGSGSGGPSVDLILGDIFGPFSNQSASLFVAAPRSTAVTLSYVGTAARGTILVDGLGSPVALRSVGTGTTVFIQGSGGADSVSGGNTLIGLQISTGDGADSLTGGLGHDLLEGGAGNDTLVGQGIGDTFNGGAGDDLFIAGAGNDQFNWDFGHDGHDTVIGFQHHDSVGAHDRIEISRNFGNDLAQAESLGFIRQVGSDVVIVNSTLNSLTLKNVLLSTLNDSDFIFF